VLLQEVSRLASKPPDKKAVAEAKGASQHACRLREALRTALLSRAARLAALATRSADTTGVSFAGAALHAAYYDAKFVRRGALLYRTLQACLEPRSCSGATALAEQLTAASAGPSRRRLRVASLGGGPGTDVAGLFWAERHLFRFGPAAKAARAGPGGIDCTLYDLERSWRRYTPALQRLMAPRLAIDFQPCDVRAPLPSESTSDAELGDGCNKALAAAAGGTHLFVLSYVAHETADAAAASAFAFYRSLAVAAPPGAVFLFLDVRVHSAHILDAIHAAMAAALEEGDDVAFVLERFGLSPSGAPLPAETMVLLKRRPQPKPDAVADDDAHALAPADDIAVDLAAARLVDA
jgi:hypothetical protein